MTPTPRNPAYHLVLVHSQGWQDVRDFERLKTLVEERAPDIEVFVVSNERNSPILRKRIARLPTFVFSPITLLNFRPGRGKVYAGRPMSKLEEMHKLADAGLPVPTFEEITPATALDPQRFGELVIVKPSFDLASWGQGIELLRRNDVHYRAPSSYPASHPGRHGPMIAQRFIDCRRAMTCRVLTLFGRPLFTYYRESTKDLDLFPTRKRYEQHEFMPAPPDVRVFITRDPSILTLAEHAYQAIPDCALQACDILKDRDDQLHILEVNPGGGTWMFSSENAPGYRRVLGVEDLAAAFNAFDVCAGLLIRRTRAEAK